MAKKKTTARRNPSIFYMLLHISASALFLLQGLHGIVTFGTSRSQVHTELSRIWAGGTAAGEVVVVLLFLSIGAMLAGTYFLPKKDSYRKRMFTAVVVLWAVLVVLLNGLLPNFHSRFFDWLLWAHQLLVHIIILLSLMILRNHRL